jgi:hypothetical protein
MAEVASCGRALTVTRRVPLVKVIPGARSTDLLGSVT